MFANYKVYVIQAVWEEALDVVRDSVIRARINGVKHCMTTFEFFFGILLEEFLLKHGDNLSKKTLQNPKLSSSEGQQVAALTNKTLNSIQTWR